MYREKWHGLVLLSCFAAILVSGCVNLSQTTPGVTVANFECLRMGMSPEQVEAILGGPADVRFVTGAFSGDQRIWRGVEGEVHVFWSGLADLPACEGSFFYPSGLELQIPEEESFAERLRRHVRF